jgi:hypothetical protein
MHDSNLSLCTRYNALLFRLCYINPILGIDQERKVHRSLSGSHCPGR